MSRYEYGSIDHHLCGRTLRTGHLKVLQDDAFPLTTAVVVPWTKCVNSPMG